MYKQSVEDPATFWGEIAAKFHWKMPPTKENFLSYNFNVNNGPIEVRLNWFIQYFMNELDLYCKGTYSKIIKPLFFLSD